VNGAVIFIFLAVLWLPIVDNLTGIDVTRPPGENRLPARWPQLAQGNFSGLQHYLAGTETYYNDHFGFRKRLIRWNQQWRQRLYRDESGFKVVTGQHGWLFTGELQMIEHYLGTAKFSTAQLQAWQKLLEKRRDWLAARGIKFLFIITPDKQSIYPEELPDWLQAAAPAHCETKLDQFLRHMKEHSTVEVLDLRPALLAAKTNAPLFLQTDTHWNYLGGFIGGQAVIRTLQKNFPELPPLRNENFLWCRTNSSGGDLARQAGREIVENNFYSYTTVGGLAAPNVQISSNIFSSWGPHNVGVISENPAPLTVHAVFFHDSFAHAWQGLFGYSFKRVVFLNEKREFSTKLIEENHPQVVGVEMLERFFNTLVPEELMAQDALP
jgi:alginate O-acetyltransferase complex protein AlgJ